MRTARVFPRRTAATPNDDFAFVGDPPLGVDHFTEVHVSCAFTWDRAEAERLSRAWRPYADKVLLGGPAHDDPGGEFVPGLYLKRGMTITSRGCPRRCEFCLVPQREGRLRTLNIAPGWDILDNNLLACPRRHIEAVLDMLREQAHAARFTGGLDARLCQPWLAKRLASMRLDILYTAYDSDDTRADVERTVAMLRDAGLTRHEVGCYVLVGYGDDTPSAALSRLSWVRDIGAMPFAMYYRPAQDARKRIPADWQGLVRAWTRPGLIFARHAEAEEPLLVMRSQSPSSSGSDEG